MKSSLLRILRLLPLALLSPLIAGLSLLALWLTDLCWLLFGRRRKPLDGKPDNSAASVVIPNWNGRDLLEKYLPSVVEAMAGNPRNEVLVVDNGSSDGSVEFLRAKFPSVRVIALKTNLGFGGGSNVGFREARNDVVVLLNSDMRVAPDFLPPLLAGFSDEKVFAVSCQIFFSDPEKRREETGLTQGWWKSGSLRLRHREDRAIERLYPCLYGGGGSSAFDRRKFLELGGFDHLLRPFYLEDTDMGFLAWKRGWKVLYQPASHVWHEHRGTIGKKFSSAYIESVVGKNFLLFCWKNIHEPARLFSHIAFSWAGAIFSMFAGSSRERASLPGLGRAFLQLAGAMAARWRARSLAVVSDTEAFLRPMGGYYRDRFERVAGPEEKLSVLFVSPYPICPPTHGGGVFMYETVRQLGRLVDLHLIVLLDSAGEEAPHAELRSCAASLEFHVRSDQAKGAGSIVPYAVREFGNQEVEWLIHRQIFTRKVDVVQIEYTNMGQYVGDYRQIAWTIFEHDVYFQSIARGLRGMRLLARGKAFLEYLRALRYELKVLPRFDEVQTCTVDNTEYLASFLPRLRPKIHDNLRAGIDTGAYRFQADGRRPNTLLFLGSFRHLPNQEALRWFVGRVMPHVSRQRPEAKLIVIGSDPPPPHTIPNYGEAVEMVGFVEDIKRPLAEYAVFVCPILSGSGVRVKLLEAFAAGIPTVSTRLGAEGLCSKDGEYCSLADDPEEFADQIVRLLDEPAKAAEMARRARAFVSENRDITKMTRELELTYRRTLASKRPASAS
jgi:O-antigen biosynthesis protein